MPATEPKGQHFVHRAYLKGFLDPATICGDDGYLWVYLPGKVPFRQRVERVAKRNYYYCYEEDERRKFNVEHGLQKLEDAALPVLEKLRSSEFTLTPDERMTFAGYVALSHCRVPTAQRNFDRIASLESARQLEFVVKNPNVLESMLKRHQEQTGEIIDAGRMKEDLVAGSVVVEQSSRSWSLRRMFEVMLLLQDLVVRMHWTFVIAGSDDPGFVTSDNPVALFDPLASPLAGIGFASSPQAHFSFPISSRICLVTRHSNALPSKLNIPAYQVRLFNKALISRADSQVYAPFREDKLQVLVDSLPRTKPRKGRVLFRKGEVIEE